MPHLPLHILYAEDDEEDRSFFREGIALSGEAVVLTEFPDGAALLQFLMTLKDPYTLPYVIVSDMNMPAMDAKDVLRALRLIPRLQHIPIVIFTTSSSLHDREVCSQLGARGFFSKPISESEIKKITQEIILLCKKWCFTSEEI